MEKEEKIILTEEQENYIKGFSWECLLAGFWWPLFNELWIYTIGMFVPVVNLVIWAYLCIKGREVSFNNKKWISFNQYKDRQNITLVIGIFKIVFAVLFTFAIIFMFVLCFDIIVEFFNYFLTLINN